MASKKIDGNNKFSMFMALAATILIVIVVILVQRDSTTNFSVIRDIISGLEYGRFENRSEAVKINIPDDLFDNHYFPNQGEQILAQITTFFNVTHRDFESVSYVRNSFKSTTDEQSFNLESDTGEKYKVTLKPNQADFELKIHNYNDEIFTYKSAEHHYVTKNPLNLANTLLPVTIPTKSDSHISISSTDSKKLNIAKENCDLSDDEAIELSKNWLKSNDYAPENFEFSTACD